MDFSMYFFIFTVIFFIGVIIFSLYLIYEDKKEDKKIESRIISMISNVNTENLKNSFQDAHIRDDVFKYEGVTEKFLQELQNYYEIFKRKKK